MEWKPDCILCLFRQALNTARLVTDDAELHTEILRDVAGQIPLSRRDISPAALSQCVYETVSRVTGEADPFRAQKAETNRLALALLPELRGMIEAAPDPLDAALHVAVAGNIIDLGIGHEFEIERDVRELMTRSFAISAIEDFRAELQPGHRLLYLGDNAGEIAFDRLLVEYLLQAGLQVTFTVKSGPIINDAMMDDARTVGLTDRVPVIETGSDDIGVNWDNVSPAFREAVGDADVIVAKGHGNFETCVGRPENFYFLLKAKCTIVADALGCEFGDIVFVRRAQGATMIFSRRRAGC